MAIHLNSVVIMPVVLVVVFGLFREQDGCVSGCVGTLYQCCFLFIEYIIVRNAKDIESGAVE